MNCLNICFCAFWNKILLFLRKKYFREGDITHFNFIGAMYPNLWPSPSASTLGNKSIRFLLVLYIYIIWFFFLRPRNTAKCKFFLQTVFFQDKLNSFKIGDENTAVYFASEEHSEPAISDDLITKHYISSNSFLFHLLCLRLCFK